MVDYWNLYGCNNICSGHSSRSDRVGSNGWNMEELVLWELYLLFRYYNFCFLLVLALTDFFQYFVALIGTTVFAYVVVNSPVVGGFDGFLEKIHGVQSHLSFFMTPSSGVPVSKGFWSSSFFVFLVYVTVIWWSSHNSDGGGYFIQRMCAAKNERHA